MTDTALSCSPQAGTDGARVAIIEDHGLLAQSLAFALSNLGASVTVVEDLESSAVLRVLGEKVLDLVLLDFDLGDAGLGLHLIEPITALGLQVVMLTASVRGGSGNKCF